MRVMEGRYRGVAAAEVEAVAAAEVETAVETA